MTSRFLHRHRRLLTSAAIAAGLMALAIGGPARAQGVNGSGVVTSGSGVITSPNPTTTQVNTSGQQTIIRWRPTDTAVNGGPINFLPAGNTLTFIGNVPGYTVLNRFLGVDPATGLPIPISRQIALNGTVSSFTNVTGVNQPGGNIWFYNAGGLLIGASGVINVGSLVLTANDIDTTGGLFGFGGTIRFRGGAGSTATVQIDTGAQVNVGGTGVGDAYMAVVAPRVVQRGLVEADGSVAYVAAEQADIRINNGLFDINVLAGAEGGTVIDHSGVTTGTAQRDADGRDSRIYMVAMPKNDAVTMLVAGQIGYRDPVTAQVEPNGAIRLAAGFNMFGGELTQNPGSTTAANMVVNDVIFNSALVAHASNNLDAAPVGTIPAASAAAFAPPAQQGRLRFNQDALLIGDNRATLTLGNQQAAVALANLTLVSGGRAGGTGTVQVSLAHDAAQPGPLPNLTVGGALLLDASKLVDPFAGGNATAGLARLSLNGGTVNAAAITLSADAIAGFGSAALGGAGQGGRTELILAGATSRVDAATVTLSSDGTGGGSRDNPNLGIIEVAAQGGAGTGGTALASVTGGAALNVGQALMLNARGTGGTGSALAGNGSGGIARLAVTDAASRVTSPVTQLDTAGRGGSFIQRLPNILTLTAVGGTGTGGTSEIASTGTVNLGDSFLGAEGTGGNANSGANRGGDGLGGTANLLVTGGTAQLTGLVIDVDGLAGGGNTADPALVSAVHGVGRGGSAAVRADGAPLTITGGAQITGVGNTASGRGLTTLERSGGTVEFRASNGGTVNVTGDIDIDVSAGFDPTLGGNEATNRDARGGVITLAAVDNGVLAARGYNLRSDAFTADAVGTIGSASGGTITLEARRGGRLNSGVAGTFASASGLAGSGPVGGQGLGGTINVTADNGLVDLGGFSQLAANGTSGLSNSGVAGARGRGGTVRLQSLAGTSEIRIGDMFVQADGQTGQLVEGGIIASSDSAGDGEGGSFIIDMSGGTIAGTTLDVSANGRGGASRGAFGGGNGTGGTVNLNLTGGMLNVDVINLTADGIGEAGGPGQRAGTGTGGRVTVNLTGGALRARDMTLAAEGFGGAGRFGTDATPFGGVIEQAGDGGLGLGGTVTFNADGGTLDVTDLRLRANGTGGDGGAFDALGGGTTGDTGDGGNGTGGTASFNRRGAATTIAGQLAVLAVGTGGAGGALLATPGQPGVAVGGDGGIGRGGTASLLVQANAGAIAQHLLDASGAGGAGANADVGGDGGAAFGGNADIIVDGVDAGALNAIARGGAAGGAGGQAFNGDGGDGGAATGGRVGLTTIGAAAKADVAGENFDMAVTGGRGGNGARNITQPAPPNGVGGGNGGAATGGTVALLATGGTINLAPLAGNVGITLINSPRGGAGGDSAEAAAGNGGNMVGGTIALIAAGGTISTQGAALRLNADGTVAQGGTGAGAGAAGSNRGGTVTIRAETGQTGAGSINLGPTQISANGQFGGRIDIRNLVGGDAVRFAGLTLAANGVPVAAGGAAMGDSGLYLDAGDGRIVIAGNADFATNSAITLAARGAGQTFVDGDFTAATDNRIDIFHTGRTGTGATLRTTRGATLIAGTQLASSGGLVIDAGGALRADGTASVALGDIRSGAAITSLSGGPVTLGTATAGTSLTAQAGGALTLTGPASAGSSIALTGGSLNIGALNAATAITLRATASGFTSTGPLRAGTDLTITATGDLAIADARAGDDIRLTGTGMTLGDLRATGTGADNDGDGSDFTITAAGDVTVSHAEAASDFRATANRFATGLNSIITGGDIIIAADTTVDLGNSTAGGRIDATGSQIAFNTLTAGSHVQLETRAPILQRPTTGPAGDGSIVGGQVTAGGFVEARGTRIAMGNVTAGTDVILSSFGGGLAVGDVTAGDDIFLTVNGSNANPNAISPDSQTGQASATQFNLTAGNLRSTGLGSDTAASGPRSFTGAGPATNAIRVRASGNVQTGNITTAGSAILAADLGTVTAGNVTGTDGVGVFVRGNAALGNVTTGGLFWLGDSSQFFGVVPAYRVTNFAPSQTATSGNAVLGAVTAGLIRGTTPGGLTFGSLASTGALLWTSTGGALTGGTLTSGGDMTLNFGGDMLIGAVNGTGQLLLTSANGRIAAPSISGARIEATAASDVTLPIVQSAGQVVLGSVNGAVRVATNLVAGGGVIADGRSVFLRAGGPLTVTNALARAGDIDIAAAGNLTVNAANASAALTLSSTRTATIGGVATGAAITLTSGDIVISPNGRLGTLGTTQALTLVNSDRASPTFIGGAGTRAGWHLDAGELTRLFGANISIDAGRITAPGNSAVGTARAPDVFVDDFTVNAAQQLGPTGSFTILTPGKLRVVGDARFTNMADAQAVRISANDALEVILGDGSLVLTDAAGALGGVLRLQSDDVIVATLAAIADVAAAPTLDAINDRLGRNDGITSDQGAIAAKGIEATVARGLYIQNSGVPGIAGRDYASRRGFSVGTLGLNIITGGAQTGPTAGPVTGGTARIVINGQQLGAAGPVTGLDFIPLIRINGAAGATTGFDPASTANGCIIVNVAACRIGPDGFPVQDAVAGGAGAGGIGDGRPIAPLVIIRGLDPLSGEPLIDDPVTGAGNEDFWTPDEEEEEAD
jgi:hypothetical protein